MRVEKRCDSQWQCSANEGAGSRLSPKYKTMSKIVVGVSLGDGKMKTKGGITNKKEKDKDVYLRCTSDVFATHARPMAHPKGGASTPPRRQPSRNMPRNS